MTSQMENFIDLQPDASLLDANFDGYKLSLDKFPTMNVELPSEVRILQTSNSQYGLEHVKLFSDINYLVVDKFSSDDVKRFYVIADDLGVYAITYSAQGSTFESIKKVAAINLPDDFNSREERYPANISFPNKNFAFISNGYGQLSLYSTGDRSKTAVWEECLDVSKLLNTNDNKSAAFIIAESVSLKEDCVDVLLRKVIPKERHSSKSHFWNKLLWISLTHESNEWKMSAKREVICEGHIEMITFDSSINNLIVDSCGDVNFVYDSAQKISRNHRTSLVEDESGQIVEESMEEDKKLYCWMQSDEDVTVVFNIGEVIHKKDVSLTMGSSKIKITIKGELLLEGELGGVIHVDGSTYTIDKNILELTLSKSSAIHWNQLIVGDQRGIYQETRDDLLANSDFIERFFTNKLEDLSGNKNFNTEQLEDCDMADEEDIYKIRWLSGDTHDVKYVSDITGHNVLFSVALGDAVPKCLCLRMDVDGILWELDSREDKLAVHKATFNAFGYVQASKTQRKFCTCSPDCSYAAIVEDKRRAFIYWQPTALDTDLRNRTSGQRVKAVAKQNLISLSMIDSDGFKRDVLENIVGVFADTKALFILTTKHLIVIVLK